MKINHLKLKDLKVLIFDCQATHSHPARGHVFEIGWLRTRASETFQKQSIEKKVERHLVHLPGQKELPRHIQKITGIESDDFKTALSMKEIWIKFLESARKTASENKMSMCPTVIHYARYEEPFLRQIFRDFNSETEFPFQIICTHQITRHLFSGLPRKGLRAVAGYFGSSVPVSRRSLHHVQGTFSIWKHIIVSLENKKNISTLGELLDWLNSSSPSAARSEREYPMAEKFRQNLPDLPGIYRLFRANGDLLYIGKAKSLKRRINSYFQKRGKHSEHILEMLSQAKSLTYSVTETAFEAALREADEIKVLAPSFNRALRISEQGPFFSTTDLRSVRHKPDRFHRIGPLPSKKYIESLSSLLEILNDRQSFSGPHVIDNILATTEEYRPEKTLFLEGIEEFKKINLDHLRFPVTLQSMMKLGSILWKEKMEEAVEKDRETEEEILVLKPYPQQKKKKSRSISWSPESLAKVMTSMVRIGTYMVRRARWFYLLTESSLAWERSGSGKKQKNLVIFQNGLSFFQTPIPMSKELPRPPGHGKSRFAKQRNFDLFTYDRMRIVNTEIRRVLKENRTVELCLGPDFVIPSERLKKILQWI